VPVWSRCYFPVMGQTGLQAAETKSATDVEITTSNNGSVPNFPISTLDRTPAERTSA